MALADDVQAHADSLAGKVATAIAAKIIAEPMRYAKDELGHKLVVDIHKEIDLACLTEDFSDLDQ